MKTRKELVASLGVTNAKLSKWLKAGMPRAGHNQYDPEVVANWLLEKGIATRNDSVPEQQEVIARTRGECARLLGCSVRTVAEYLQDPTFPGKSGSPGHQDGYFPIDQIQAWRGNRDGGRSANGEEAKPSARERLTLVNYEKALMELQRLRGQLIDAAEVRRFYGRTNAYVITTLGQLPLKLNHALPSDTSDEVREAFREISTNVVNECRELIAELIKGDADEQQTQS